MNMTETIDRIIRYYGLRNSKSAVAKKLGMPLSTYVDNLLKATNESPQIRATSNMLYQVILKLCVDDNLNPNWIFFGRYPKSNTDKDAEIVNKSDLKNHDSLDIVAIPYYTNLKTFNTSSPKEKYIVMPKTFLQEINANFISVTMPDDTMNPNIKQNSIVFIDLNDKNELNNAVYLLSYKKEFFIKRLEFHAEIILLKSDNVAYNTITAVKKDLILIGKVKNSISIDSLK